MVVRSTNRSPRGPGFGFQHPPGDLESSVTVVLEDPKPSSGLHEYQTCTHHTDTWLGKTLKHIKSRKESDAKSTRRTQ